MFRLIDSGNNYLVVDIEHFDREQFPCYDMLRYINSGASALADPSSNDEIREGDLHLRMSGRGGG